MRAGNLWLAAKLVIVLINVFGLPMLFDGRSGFGFVAGGLSGAIVLIVLSLWMRAHPVAHERLGAIDAPFWPMRKYPMTYWSTMGGALSFASIVSILANVRDPKAFHFFGGVLMLGLGIVLAVILARRFKSEGKG